MRLLRNNRCRAYTVKADNLGLVNFMSKSVFKSVYLHIS